MLKDKLLSNIHNIIKRARRIHSKKEYYEFIKKEQLTEFILKASNNFTPKDWAKHSENICLNIFGLEYKKFIEEAISKFEGLKYFKKKEDLMKYNCAYQIK